MSFSSVTSIFEIWFEIKCASIVETYVLGKSACDTFALPSDVIVIVRLFSPN